MICDNMNESGVHYAGQNKPDTERQMFHDLMCMWGKKNVTFREAESRMVVTRGWGRGK